MELYDGLYHWLAGHRTQAQRMWRRSLEAATQYTMPYDQGRAHYELGRHAAEGGGEHLQRALAIFAHLGAAYDVEQVQAAMRTSRVDYAADALHSYTVAS